MARFLKARKESIGLSPDDTQLFRGERKSNSVNITLFDFDIDQFTETVVSNISSVFMYDKTPSTTWLNIDGVHDKELLEIITIGFNLDSLILSDILNTHSRPKIQEYDNCIYISLKMLDWDDNKKIITSENLVIVIKENIVITFQEPHGDVFEPIRDRIRKNKKRIRSSGSDYLAFCLLDIVIDTYLYIISVVGEKIESNDFQLIENTSEATLIDINKNKAEITYLRKCIKPCQELVINLMKLDSELLHEKTEIHFKELQENIKLANESLETYREVLSDQLNILHSSLSNKLNKTMKFLTIFSAVFIPLTFIVGVYGTNFDNVPELHFRYSYFFMWGIMVLTAIFMIQYFRRKRWI